MYKVLPNMKKITVINTLNYYNAISIFGNYCDVRLKPFPDNIYNKKKLQQKTTTNITRNAANIRRTTTTTTTTNIRTYIQT